MTLKSNDSGWSIDPDLTDLEDVDFDQPTRLAPVELLDFNPAIDTDEHAKSSADETRVASAGVKKRASGQRQTAEFHPRSGMRATGEVTIPWSTRGRNPAAILKKFLSYVLNSLRGRGRLMVFAILAAAAVAIMFATIVRAKGDARDLVSRSRVTAPKISRKNSAPAPTHKKLAPKSGRTTLKEASKKRDASLKNAAEALIDGHLEDALVIYEDLLAASPDNESFILAVEILSNSNKGARQ